MKMGGTGFVVARHVAGARTPQSGNAMRGDRQRCEKECRIKPQNEFGSPMIDLHLGHMVRTRFDVSDRVE